MFIFPISKQRDIKKLPWITLGLIILNLFVFLCTWPDTLKKHNELTQLKIKLKGQKQPIEQIKSEINDLKNQKKSLEKLHARSRKSRHNAFSYSQQMRIIDNEIWNKKVRQQSAEAGSKRSEKAIKKLEIKIPFVIYGYTPSKKQPWRLLTYQFLHSGYIHLIFNMFFLWFVGCNTEDKWGRWFFLGLYLASGIIAALVQNIFQPAGGLPVVGASGAIAGAMGAFIARFSTKKVKLFYLVFRKPSFHIGLTDIPALGFFLSWAIGQLLGGFLSSFISSVGISFWANTGGLAFGAAIAGLMKFTDLEKKLLVPIVEHEEIKLPGGSSKLLDAKKKIKEGNLNEAEILLRNVINMEPDSLEAHITLVNLFKSAKAIPSEEMKQLIAKTIELSGRKGDEKNQVDIYYYFKNINWADNSFSIKTLLSLGKALESREDLPGAISIYQKAINEYPYDPLLTKVQFTLGKLYSIQGQREKACEIFRKILLDTPDGRNYKDMIRQELEKNFKMKLSDLA